MLFLRLSWNLQEVVSVDKSALQISSVHVPPMFSKPKDTHGSVALPVKDSWVAKEVVESLLQKMR